MAVPANPISPPPPLVLTITYDQLTGNVSVAGPIQNRFIAYGILGLAFEAILHRGIKEGGEVEGGRVVVPRGFRGQ